MTALKEILYKARIEAVHGSTDVPVGQVTFDSRKVAKGAAFVAVRGTQVDGHRFVDAAVASGAVAVVCEEFPEQLESKVTYVKVADTAEALAYMASNFHGNPSSKLKLVGITGTNGKTTVVTLLFRLARALGLKAGLISTVENRINDKVLPSTHTTPDPVQLNALLAQMVEARCTHCFMEVSSHAVHQQRIVGLEFAMGVFTNITHDHLDYHGTFDAYIKAKKAFFDLLPKEAYALVNADDKHAAVMLQNCAAKKRTFALRGMADHRARIMEDHFDGLHLNIDGNEVHTQLIGSFNGSNLLAAYAVAVTLGGSPLEVLTAISKLLPVRGRFEKVKSPSGIHCIVDYAHTPDALKNVLATINNIRTGNEKLLTVIGCGGDRDKAKRPIMAKLACDLSDQVLFTSDNPRGEDPQAIVNDMLAGLDPVDKKKVLTILDRAEAIRTSCALAKDGDIILVAGKGHETYQEVKGLRTPFNDVEVLQNMLSDKAG